MKARPIQCAFRYAIAKVIVFLMLGISLLFNPVDVSAMPCLGCQYTDNTGVKLEFDRYLGSAIEIAGSSSEALLLAAGGVTVQFNSANVMDEAETHHDGAPTYQLSDRIWLGYESQQQSRSATPVISWRQDAATLTRTRAFATAIPHGDYIFLLGGIGEGVAPNRSSIKAESIADVTALLFDEGQLRVLEMPPLPVAAIQPSAVMVGQRLYVWVERSLQNDLGQLYVMDVSALDAEGDLSAHYPADTLVWNEVENLPWVQPSGSQISLMSQADGTKLWVLRDLGLNSSSGTQVWQFDQSTDAWVQSSDVVIADLPLRSDRVASAPFGQSHFIVAGGFDPAGVEREALSGSGRARSFLVYNTVTNAWSDYPDLIAVNPRPEGDIGLSPHMGASLIAVPGQTERSDWLLAGEVWGAGHSVEHIAARLGELASTRHQSVQRYSPKPSTTGFGWQNVSVLFLYLLAMLLVGVYFASRNSSLDGYFRGEQSIPWWAAACSMYATMLSSLTYVALPALVYRTDWGVYLGTWTLLLVAPVAVYIAMPFFRQIDASSAYEYLSKRFSMPVRWFASGLFALFQIGRMGIVMALTALALATVLPFPSWQGVLIMGAFCLIYSTMGGVRAVIWTDTIQTVVLLVGAFVCCYYIIVGVDGGIQEIAERGIAANKFQLAPIDFGANSITTLALWVIVLGGIGQNLSSYTADQAVVQRYVTTKNQTDAAKSIWANGLLAPFGSIVFFLIGTGLYVFYQVNPEQLDPNLQTDQIFPAFIATQLPVGIAGLVIAGIFAAAQSTVSTSMNSVATSLVTDFLTPFNLCSSDRGYLIAARVLTFTVGCLGTLAGLIFVDPEIRSLMESYFKVIGMFMGALGGVFILGVISRSANATGAMSGLVAGVAAMLSAWVFEWANGYLFATIGIVFCLVTGLVVSQLSGGTPADKWRGLTIHSMKQSANP